MDTEGEQAQGEQVQGEQVLRSNERPNPEQLKQERLERITNIRDAEKLRQTQRQRQQQQQRQRQRQRQRQSPQEQRQEQHQELQAKLDYMLTMLKEIFGLYDDDSRINILRNTIQKFSRDEKYKLIDSVERHMESLLDADIQLQDLMDSGVLQPYQADIKDSMDGLNNELMRLQILSLIQKTKCDDVIKELVGLLTTKISTVNDVLEKKLGATTDGDAAAADSSDRRNLSSMTSVEPVRPGSVQPARLTSSLSSVGSTSAPVLNLLPPLPPPPPLPSVVIDDDAAGELIGGSIEDMYINKYIKYKKKYISLKNIM